MASGYEKEACKVDAGKGWGTNAPRRWWQRLADHLILVVTYAILGCVIAGFVLGMF